MSAKRDEGTPSLKASRELDEQIATQVFGHRLLTQDEMRTEAESVWKQQPLCRVFMSGFEARVLVDGTPEFRNTVRAYSTRIEAAWLVVEKMREISATFFELRSGGTLRQCGGNVTSDALTYYARFVGSLEPRGFVEADSAPLAICLAALSARSERAS